MPGFTDVFGGSTLQPAQVAYRAVALTASVTLVWPPFATSATDYVAGIMDVTPSGPGFTITSPDATLVTNGQASQWRNLGANSFTLLDSAGGVIAVIAAGTTRYVYLQSNATAAGTWASIVLGVGSSNLDASQLAGLGLKAIANTLALAPVTTTFSVNYTVVSTDRAKVFVWTGGSGTATLPTLSVVQPDWQVGFHNSGTGTLTLAPVGGTLIDGAANIVLQVGESCFVDSGPAAWYTVGRGRNTQFNFTKLAKSVTGGTTTLSQTEAANVVQVYTGALVSNETLVVPAVVQVYYVINTTTGAHTFTVQSPIAGGSSVSVDTGTAAILFCDGTNVYNCTTSGVASINATLPVGAVGSPSLNFVGDLTTGIYQPTSSTIAVTIAGTERLRVTATGLNSTAIGATTASTGAFTTLAASGNATVGGTLGVTGVLTATGGVVGNVTGNVTGNLTGNADTVTNGVYTSGSYANPAWITSLAGSKITGNIGGNAATATALQTARAINTVSFDGTADITVTAAAGTLTGTTLNATVVTSSLTSVGTVATGVWNGTVVTGQYGGTGVANTGKTITLAGSLAVVGAALTLTCAGATNVTLPTAGTLVAAGAITTSGLTQSTGKLLGRGTAATGAIEEITLGSNLSLSGTTLNAATTAGVSITSGVAIANTETRVLAYTCAANELAAGTTFTIKAFARVAGGGAATPTLRVRVGTTTLTGNIAATLTGVAANVGNTDMEFLGTVTCRSSGAGGTILGGLTQLKDGSSVAAKSNGTAVAVDTTAASELIELTFISGAGGNTYTFDVASIVKEVA